MTNSIVSSLFGLSILTAAACGGPNRRATAPAVSSSTTTTSGPSPDTGREVDTNGASSALPGDVPRSEAVPLTLPTTATPVWSGATPAMNGAQIAAALAAIDDAEIALAQVALTKAKSSRVLDFAQREIADGGRAQAALKGVVARDGLTPEEGPVSDRVKLRSERLLLVLRTDMRSDFDRAYLDDEIEQDRDALDRIDDFIVHAQSPSLKSHLRDLRRTIADRLRDAVGVKTSLGT